MKGAKEIANYRVVRFLNDVVTITDRKIGKIRAAVEVRVAHFSKIVPLKQVLLRFAISKKEVLSSQKSPVLSDSHIGFLPVSVLYLFRPKGMVDQVYLRELRSQVEEISRTPFFQGKSISCIN